MTDLNQLNGTYTIDPTHSRIGFVTRHAMVTKVRGSFNEFEGTATTGEDLQGAEISLTAQVASIDTRNEQRDGHLRTGDFFDAEQFPTITFASTEVTAVDADTLRVTGDLTMKGITKAVTIDFDFEGAATDPMGNDRIGFEGRTTINRTEFGMTFNAAMETGGVMVSEDVTLEFEVSAIKNA
ncbi:YceI family protein [Kytococcus sp. Marseille-QA3725]